MTAIRPILLLAFVLSWAFAPASSRLLAADPPAAKAAPPEKKTPAQIFAQFADEGTNRSQIAEIFGYLTDVIGPRLTGSANCRRANDWAGEKLRSWGLTNVQVEPWGPFGRGWAVKRFSAQIVEPQCIPLIAWPKAWSHGIEWPVVGDVFYLDARTEGDLEALKGKLKGCIVLLSAPREIALHFGALATRMSETNLLRLANASPSGPGFRRRPDAERRRPTPAPTNPPPANAPAPANPPPVPSTRSLSSTDRLRFAIREGAAATVTVSATGDGGALLVGWATVLSGAGGDVASPWATNAPAGPPQIVLAAEHYSRLVHMLQAGEKVKMALEVQTQFQDRDLMCYNTLAEIPGSDLKQELVMVGAHLDSLPSGTGGTDNGAGVVVAMEAVRLIQALKLQPRRTVRIGLWSGEEQGLLGSKAYVARHFGYYTNEPAPAPSAPAKGAAAEPSSSRESGSGSRRLVKRSEYPRFSAYYNLDNGAGRIRGIYLQGNEALRTVFRPWLEPMRDLGAATIAASNTGGTDHLSFDAIGLPGFQFIQDSLEYNRSYHTSIDVRERAPVEDLQQAAIVMAAFVYQTAMLDEKLPRKPLEEARSPRRR